MLFDNLFWHHKLQLVEEVWTTATGPRSTFAKILAQMKIAAQEDMYRGANMTPNKHVEFQIRLSDAETENTTWSIADPDRVANQLLTEIYGIT